MLNDDTANLLSDLPGNFDSVMRIQIQTFEFESNPNILDTGIRILSRTENLKSCIFFLVNFKNLKVHLYEN